MHTCTKHACLHNVHYAQLCIICKIYLRLQKRIATSNDPGLDEVARTLDAMRLRGELSEETMSNILCQYKSRLNEHSKEEGEEEKDRPRRKNKHKKKQLKQVSDKVNFCLSVQVGLHITQLYERSSECLYYLSCYTYERLEVCIALSQGYYHSK